MQQDNQTQQNHQDQQTQQDNQTQQNQPEGSLMTTGAPREWQWPEITDHPEADRESITASQTHSSNNVDQLKENQNPETTEGPSMSHVTKIGDTWHSIEKIKHPAPTFPDYDVPPTEDTKVAQHNDNQHKEKTQENPENHQTPNGQECQGENCLGDNRENTYLYPPEGNYPQSDHQQPDQQQPDHQQHDYQQPIQQQPGKYGERKSGYGKAGKYKPRKSGYGKDYQLNPFPVYVDQLKPRNEWKRRSR